MDLRRHGKDWHRRGGGAVMPRRHYGRAGRARPQARVSKSGATRYSRSLRARRETRRDMAFTEDYYRELFNALDQGSAPSMS